MPSSVACRSSRGCDAWVDPAKGASTGIAFGGTGPWGSGKSSILNMIEEQVTRRCCSPARRPQVRKTFLGPEVGYFCLEKCSAACRVTRLASLRTPHGVNWMVLAN